MKGYIKTVNIRC